MKVDETNKFKPLNLLTLKGNCEEDKKGYWVWVYERQMTQNIK